MPPRNPQYVLRNSNGNRVGTLYRTGDGKVALYDDVSGKEATFGPDGFEVGSLTTEKYPVADVTTHGAVGNGITDDTAAVQSAITAADTADGAGVVYLPPGTYLVTDDFVVPSGVSIRGAGMQNTTIKSTAATLDTFVPENETHFAGFTLDQNCQNRTPSSTVGIHLYGTSHVTIEYCNFINISDGGEGKGVELYCDEADAQDTHSNVIYLCRFEGSTINPPNSGDFLVRARTAFANTSLTDDDYTRFIRDNWVHRCLFTGVGKAAVEWVGPATRRNLTSECIARNFTTTTGIFESSLGGKHNTFTDCGIYDCYANSTSIGFYSDGYDSTGVPLRKSEDDLFKGCRVVNFHQLADGSSLRGFRIRHGERVTIDSCYVDGITKPAGSTGTTTGIDLNFATDCKINGTTIQGTDQMVTGGVSAGNNTRPVWNNVVGGGPLGGIDLSTTPGQYGRQLAMATDDMLAVWTGSAWKKTDGTIVTP